MTPSALRAYLRQRGEASLVDLTAHFGANSALLEDLIAYWQKKGSILESRQHCGKTCVHCAEGVVLYRWQERETEKRQDARQHVESPPSAPLPQGKT
jgi:hypothetical protein